MGVWEFEPGQNLEGFELLPLIVSSVMLRDVPTLVSLFLVHNYLKSFDLYTIKCLFVTNIIADKQFQDMCVIVQSPRNS